MGDHLLPQERDMWTFAPGEAVVWSFTQRGGYGMRVSHVATVVRVTDKRVRIRLRDGSEKSVSAHALQRRPRAATKADSDGGERG